MHAVVPFDCPYCTEMDGSLIVAIVDPARFVDATGRLMAASAHGQPTAAKPAASLDEIDLASPDADALLLSSWGLGISRPCSHFIDANLDLAAKQQARRIELGSPDLRSDLARRSGREMSMLLWTELRGMDVSESYVWHGYRESVRLPDLDITLEVSGSVFFARQPVALYRQMGRYLTVV
jgi:hypothetical protein